MGINGNIVRGNLTAQDKWPIYRILIIHLEKNFHVFFPSTAIVYSSPWENRFSKSKTPKKVL